jgi:hypothetical protein
MRDIAERVTRFKPMHALVYWVQYLLVTSILGFPLLVYEDYFREHKYGLATQTFGPWMGDQLKGLLVNLVLGGILAMLLFGIVPAAAAHVVDLGRDRRSMFFYLRRPYRAGIHFSNIQQDHAPG